MNGAGCWRQIGNGNFSALCVVHNCAIGVVDCQWAGWDDSAIGQGQTLKEISSASCVSDDTGRSAGMI